MVISLLTKGYLYKDTKKLYLNDKPKYSKINIKFIPYYKWSNRGENEMLVWVNEI